MTQVQARKDRIVTGLTKGVEFLFKKNKIDWIKGTARLTGNGGVDVFEGETQTLRARKEIIVATGSAPRSVPGIEIDRKRIITSDEAIGLREVPKSIAIMGSGAVGVEFASIFRRFGSDVTIVELLPRLVPVEDEAVSAELEKSFRKQGITSHTGAKVTRRDGERRRRRRRRRSSPTARRKTLRADYLLVATGRGPVTTGLERRTASACRSRRATSRSTRCTGRTCPGISAIGDVITLGAPGHPQLAHVSSAEGIIAAERIAGPGVAAAQLRPRARLHLLRSGDRQRRPDRARSARRAATTCASARSRSACSAARRWRGETDGFVKIVADKKYDEVLGVHMIGPRSTELVAEATRRAAARVDGRRADSDDSRASDHGRGDRRGGARRARRRDPFVTISAICRRPDCNAFEDRYAH